MAKSNPRQIPGRWRVGFALDQHTLSSDFIGHDEHGHARFDSKRSELGELLYRLKSKADVTVVDEIVDAAANFIKKWKPGVDCILPVPATKRRNVQPVMAVAQGIAKKLNLALLDGVLKKVKDTPQLKDVLDYDERTKLLAGAYKVERSKTKGRKILLFDDLFRSGATMNAITNALYDEGNAAEVFALTLTRTRSNT